MKRVFVVCNSNFPRGGAVANYIQYLILCIQECGFETILVSDINSEYLRIRIHNKIKYKNFNIEPINISKNRLIRHIQHRTGFVCERIAILMKNRLSSEDVVIVLGQNPVFYKALLSLRNRIGFKIICGLLEMFDRANYSGNDRLFNRYQYVLEEILPRFNALMPISTYIEKFYKYKGVKTFCVPIMADSEEFEIKEKVLDKYRFILPANGKMKDALYEMLVAFSSLSSNELMQIELHICGVRDSIIKGILNHTQYDKLISVLHVHDWMKYDELIELYQNMNFLILARKTSQMTLANFPSKVPETMGFGIVPVVSDVGDYTKYYLQNGIDSIFIDGWSPEECLLAIRKAINLNEQEYIQMSRNAIKCVKDKFDYHVWTDRISKMIESV